MHAGVGGVVGERELDLGLGLDQEGNLAPVEDLEGRDLRVRGGTAQRTFLEDFLAAISRFFLPLVRGKIAGAPLALRDRQGSGALYGQVAAWDVQPCRPR